jgi:hypothetical protein
VESESGRTETPRPLVEVSAPGTRAVSAQSLNGIVSSGDNSSVVVNQGISAQEVQTLTQALADLAKPGLFEMQGIAYQVFQERANDLAGQIVMRLLGTAPWALNAFSDVDVQVTVAMAQQSYARYGSDLLGSRLVTLVSRRCQEDARGLRAHALNDAVTTIGRLSEPEVAILSAAWMLTSVALTVADGDRDDLLSWLDAHSFKAMREIPANSMLYDHLVSVGCAMYNDARVWNVVDSLASTCREGFRRSFPPGTLDARLHRIPGLLIDDPEVPGNSKFATANLEELRGMIQIDGQDLSDIDIDGLLLGVTPLPHEIYAEMCRERPHLVELVSRWNETRMPNLRLTPMGIAIAHAAWVASNGFDADLSMWIPE